MTTTNEIEQAMKTVVDAHAVLLQFHKELVALWRVIDEQLADENHGMRLKCANAEYFVRYSAEKLSAPQDWTPKWLGRFYFEDNEESETAELVATAERAYTMAFVWVAVSAKDDMPEFSLPECVLGIAHSGRNPRGNSAWNVARHGVWYNFDTLALMKNGWSKGKFPDNKSQFGVGGYWNATRVPLSSLLDVSKIRDLVTNPLRDKYAEVFRGSSKG